MDRTRWPRLWSLAHVPTLLGYGWISLVLGVEYPEYHISLLIVASVLGVVMRDWRGKEKTLHLRWRLWSRLAMGAGVIGFGSFLVATRGQLVAWLGAGTVIVGAWLCLDTLIARRMWAVYSFHSQRSATPTLSEASAIESALTDASRPLTVAEIVDRTSMPESRVRTGLAALLGSGRVDVRRDGFVGWRLVLGRRFSVRDLIDRLARPARLFSIGPAVPSRQY